MAETTLGGEAKNEFSKRTYIIFMLMTRITLPAVNIRPFTALVVMLVIARILFVMTGAIRVHGTGLRRREWLGVRHVRVSCGESCTSLSLGELYDPRALNLDRLVRFLVRNAIWVKPENVFQQIISSSFILITYSTAQETPLFARVQRPDDVT